MTLTLESKLQTSFALRPSPYEPMLLFIKNIYKYINIYIYLYMSPRCPLSFLELLTRLKNKIGLGSTRVHK